MSTSKIKNIVIIVLVIVNLFLLSLLIFDKAEAERARQEEIETLISVLHQRGIEVSTRIDFNVSAPLPCRVLRDRESEKALMERLIDYDYIDDMGGNVIFYSSATGQALLRGTGEIELIYDDNIPSLSSDYESSIVKLMKKNGIELYKAYAETNSSGDATAISFPCALDGFCVYNSELNFNVAGNRIMMINGTRVFSGNIITEEEDTIDSISVVMSFLELMKAEEKTIMEISELEAGYFMNVAVSGECTLKPVWKIIADGDAYYINAVSGRMESVSG
ncbi:MAG: hypothetical protein IJY96_08915 [Oscillospiraceae bacterium]|nr:hypothetical protein [Oscillospiraceae bacterium]